MRRLQYQKYQQAEEHYCINCNAKMRRYFRKSKCDSLHGTHSQCRNQQLQSLFTVSTLRYVSEWAIQTVSKTLELIKNRYYLYCSTISAFCSRFCKKCKPVVTRPFDDHRYVRYCIEPTPCRICKGEPLRFYLLYELMVITEICSLYASHATC